MRAAGSISIVIFLRAVSRVEQYSQQCHIVFPGFLSLFHLGIGSNSKLPLHQNPTHPLTIGIVKPIKGHFSIFFHSFAWKQKQALRNDAFLATKHALFVDISLGRLICGVINFRIFSFSIKTGEMWKMIRPSQSPHFRRTYIWMTIASISNFCNTLRSKWYFKSSSPHPESDE